MFDQTTADPADPAAGDRPLVAPFTALRRRIAAWRRDAAHREAARKLLEKDPRLLRDVGLARGDLMLAMRGAGRGD